jgi:hypothetical protein
MVLTDQDRIEVELMFEKVQDAVSEKYEVGCCGSIYAILSSWCVDRAGTSFLDRANRSLEITRKPSGPPTPET